MGHEGWDLTDKRWIRLDWIWLIPGEILIQVMPLQKEPPVRRCHGRYSQRIWVDKLHTGLLQSGRLRILTLTEGKREASVYSGTYWYGLYTEPIEKPEEQSDQNS